MLTDLQKKAIRTKMTKFDEPVTETYWYNLKRNCRIKLLSAIADVEYFAELGLEEGLVQLRDACDAALRRGEVTQVLDEPSNSESIEVDFDNFE